MSHTVLCSGGGYMGFCWEADSFYSVSNSIGMFPGKSNNCLYSVGVLEEIQRYPL